MKKTRVELLHEFEEAPATALFSQKTIAAVLCCSVAQLERSRWQGGGLPYIKLNRRCLYKKEDVLRWIASHPTVNSTAQYEGTASPWSHLEEEDEKEVTS